MKSLCSKCKYRIRKDGKFWCLKRDKKAKNVPTNIQFDCYKKRKDTK